MARSHPPFVPVIVRRSIARNREVRLRVTNRKAIQLFIVATHRDVFHLDPRDRLGDFRSELFGDDVELQPTLKRNQSHRYGGSC